MAPATIQLGAYVLPPPQAADGYEVEYGFRGASRAMANGAVVWDLFSTDPQRDLTFAWNALTEAQRTTLQDAFAQLRTGTVTLTLPDNRADLVVGRHPDQPTLKFTAYVDAKRTLRYRCTLRLQEAPT